MSLPLLTDKNDFWSRLRVVVAEVIQEQLPVLPKALGQEERGLLKVKEVCVLFSISRPTLYQWMHAGKLTSIKLGTRRYFKRSQVQALLEGGEDFNTEEKA